MHILYEWFSAHRLSPEEWQSQFGVFLSLSNRILGVVPEFSSFAHVSPLTTNFYFGALTLCLRIPQADLKLTKIRPRHRRMALLESSLTHQCKHCVGHVCLMGDVFRGSQYDQVVRKGGWAKRKEREERGDAVLKKLVREACSFPGQINQRTKNEFIDMFHERGYDELTSMVCFMGWLNFMMGSLEFPLESRRVLFAKAMLQSTGEPFKFDDIAQNDDDMEKGRQELEYATGERPAGLCNRLRANLANVKSFLSLLPSIQNATAGEKQMLKGIPTKSGAIDGYVQHILGCLPHFIGSVLDPVLKRAMAFGIRDVFCRDHQTDWTRRERIAFLYVFAKKLGDERLLNDAISLEKALPSTTEVKGYDQEQEAPFNTEGRMESVYGNAASEKLGENAFEAAAQFVYGCAGMAASVSDPVKQNLIDKVGKPQSVMDIAGMIAFFGFAHRALVFRRVG